MESRVLKAEGIVRLLSMVLAISTACLVGLDTQTKAIFFSIERKATVNDLSALWILTIVASVVAGYQLIQLCKCLFFSWFSSKDCSRRNKLASWVFLLSDQGVMYAMLATTAAATQASLIAVTGVNAFQWRKVCNIYTRFCHQIAAGLLCSLAAALLMTLLSAISARHLFRNYYSSSSRNS